MRSDAISLQAILGRRPKLIQSCRRIANTLTGLGVNYRRRGLLESAYLLPYQVVPSCFVPGQFVAKQLPFSLAATP
jgi:hypothetical protein